MVDVSVKGLVYILCHLLALRTKEIVKVAGVKRLSWEKIAAPLTVTELRANFRSTASLLSPVQMEQVRIYYTVLF